jgi:hypothetical protein
MFAEAVAGIKRALKRKAYGMSLPSTARIFPTRILITDYHIDSDSDSSIEHLTNRGNKLKKRARYVRKGQLAPPTGPVVYKRVRDSSKIN